MCSFWKYVLIFFLFTHVQHKKFSCLILFLSSYSYNSAKVEFCKFFEISLQNNYQFCCDLIIGIVATRLYDIKSLLLINFPPQRRKLWKFVKDWKNTNCYPVELLRNIIIYTVHRVIILNRVTSRCDVTHSGRENLHHFLPVPLRGMLPLFSIMTLWYRVF